MATYPNEWSNDHDRKNPGDCEERHHADTSAINVEELVNSSGHVQELDRNFGFWSIVSLSLIANNAWAAGAGALVVALYNGGGPGVLYGLIAASCFYLFIDAGLSELASAIPSSANVYHWASVTGGRYGRVCSWYAGWWNFFAWIFGCTSTSLFGANAVIAIYNLYHPDFVPQRWHSGIALLGLIWLDTAIVLFGQKYIAKLTNASGVICTLFFLTTLLTIVIMPSLPSGNGHASNAFVWTNYQNLTGWPSSGLVFLLGMLNGAYTVGTPDAVAHLSEEISNPRVNVPKGIFSQLITGFSFAFVFYIALLYGITDLDAIFNSPLTTFPLASIYYQATSSIPATAALLVIFAIDIFVTIPGAWMTAGRMLWTLGRDDATPIPAYISAVSPRWRNPFLAQITCAVLGTVLTGIYMGSATAFSAFVGLFIIFTTMSYLAALLPHILTGRKHILPGPFYMAGIKGYVIIGVACAYILVFNVLYMFPYTYPIQNPDLMNWASVMFVGITACLTGWYWWKRGRDYVGPSVEMRGNDGIRIGRVGLDREVRRREVDH